VGYPRKILREGEQVVVDVRPHWWYLSGAIAVAVVTIAGTITAAVASIPGWVVWVALTVMVVSVLWLLTRYIRWVTSRLIVTDFRIIERRGVISRRGREIPMSALTNIGYHQSLFERIIGAGDVILESAGRDSREVFPDLPRPAQIHNEIYTQLENWQAGVRGVRSAAPAPATASIPDQIDQLAQLCQRGIITEQEFQAKKAELLDRL
jgi:membrane protein YdbS with pleckstrin-like domain